MTLRPSRQRRKSTDQIQSLKMHKGYRKASIFLSKITVTVDATSSVRKWKNCAINALLRPTSALSVVNSVWKVATRWRMWWESHCFSEAINSASESPAMTNNRINRIKCRDLWDWLCLKSRKHRSKSFLCRNILSFHEHLPSIRMCSKLPVNNYKWEAHLFVSQREIGLRYHT